MVSARYLLLLLGSAQALAAGGDYMIGGGVETDTASSTSVAAVGSVGIAKSTWLSGSVATNSSELSRRLRTRTTLWDLELDHRFKALGFRLGGGYWGDPDVLESHDARASLYWQNDAAMLSGEAESRRFRLTTPGIRFAPREFPFDADGLGVSGRIHVGDNLTFRFSGMKYDYNVDFRPIDNQDVIDLLSVSRLSLINSLVDSRALVALAVNNGDKRWEFDLATRKGAIDRDRTNSLTVRYLLPVSGRSDIEVSLGYDRSDLYGSATYLSVYVYLYGET
jgi:hypothetical protein